MSHESNVEFDVPDVTNADVVTTDIRAPPGCLRICSRGYEKKTTKANLERKFDT